MHEALEFIHYEILQTAGHDGYKDGQKIIGLNDAIDKCAKVKIDLPAAHRDHPDHPEAPRGRQAPRAVDQK